MYRVLHIDVMYKELLKKKKEELVHLLTRFYEESILWAKQIE